MAEAEVHLVLVGGLPGTGKSTLAEGLADRLGWEVLRSDEVRKDLAGIGHAQSAGAPAFEGMYAPRVTEATYREVLHRADLALGMGESVVIDATWLHPQQREAARALAAARHAVPHELRCDLPVDVAMARVAARAAAGGDASDATPQIVAALAEQASGEWPEAVGIDTAVTREQALQQALAQVRPDLAAVPLRGSGPA